MKTQILQLLRSSGEYVSGQEICNSLQVSRTAVWKVINQLKEAGYEIEAVQNKGYKLISSPDLISKSELSSRIHTEWAGRVVSYKEETDSTNTDAKAIMEAGGVHGTLAVAGRQNAGRGRRGKSWCFQENQQICMTIGLRPPILPDKASMLTLVMAVSTARALNEITGLQSSIKWPNDVLIHKRKVCGILTELSAEMDFIHYVVIGVGVNVNSETFPEEIAETATSIYKETGQKISRAVIIEKIMTFFEQDYAQFMKTEDLSGLRETYESMLINKGEVVCIIETDKEWKGTALGIKNTGELLVVTEQGEEIAVYAGEVSVRGYYGYV